MRTMLSSAMLILLVPILLISQGAVCLEPAEEKRVSLHGARALPWQDELCCDSPTAHLAAEGDGRGSLGSAPSQSESELPRTPRCNFRNSSRTSHSHLHDDNSGGVCVDIVCGIDEQWQSLICDLKPRTPLSETLVGGPVAISLQRLGSQEENRQVKDGDDGMADYPVVCVGEDSIMCSIALDDVTGSVAVVTINLSNATAPAVLLSVPGRPVKPGPPVNVTHHQTIEGDLVVSWTDPAVSGPGPLSYEIRYSSNSTHPIWQVVAVSGGPNVSLDLRSRVNYSVQARCSGPALPPLWSHWSQPHHIHLDTVSYIPERVVVRRGQNTTVYCVFNHRHADANSAVWMLNFKHQLPHSLYRPLNKKVSQITVVPSERRMYDMLQCTQKLHISYSQMYVEGAVIDISCETNGDIDAMTCSWSSLQRTTLTFYSRWADLPCEVMEDREQAGEVVVGEMGKAVCQAGSLRSRGVKSCTIQPLRMNCYKLWLEVRSPWGPIRSRPVYVSPTDHVKPYPPSHVKAVSMPSEVLVVTWEPPPLPVEGLQCQVRHHSPSAMRAQPEWKVQSPTRVPVSEVPVSDMCRVYVVQVRCMHTNGTGYWSDWSEPIYSTPQNSRAPEQGPDFWRVLQDDPSRNQTNVTLLFKHLPVAEHSYCVDGLEVQHQASGGAVTSEMIEQGPSYSFEWKQEVVTVTVKAYNSLGSSTTNTNMTLDKRPKRRCVRSFSVSMVNSTCVSLCWTLLDVNSSLPLAMVLQWDTQHSWARIPYTEKTVYLRGDFFGSEEYGFTLYPVFTDGEGEPVHAIATRGDPAAIVLLLIITFLSVVLFVTLVLSQNQMKRLMWKDVPNPKNCSWAKGLDLRKADSINHLFRLPEGLPAWPLLLASETISEAVIVDKIDLLAPGLAKDPGLSLSSTLVQAAPAQTVGPASGLVPSFSPSSAGLFPDLALEGHLHPELLQTNPRDSEGLVGGTSSVTPNIQILESSDQGLGNRQPADPHLDLPSTRDSSLSVTYATVLLSDPLRDHVQDQDQPQLSYKLDGSGCSSSDEGNFSANNSDISGSFPGGLWELESSQCGSGEELDPRREDEGMKGEKDLYYLGMGCPGDEEESDEEEEESEEQEGMEEESKIMLLKNVVLNREDCFVDSNPLLGNREVRFGGPSHLVSGSMSGSPQLYLPQFRAVPGKS